MDIAARSLKTKRTVITKLLEEGLYPYTKRYLGTFDNHFSTIGLVGMNEAALNANWIRQNLTQDTAQEFAVRVLKHMRERLSDYQEEYGDLYNLEATPAESTAFRLAKHDVKRFPGIITAAEGSEGAPYYTNSSHIPVGFTDDVFEALTIQNKLQTLYTSGTVFHAFIGEKLPDWKAAANLVKKIAENFELPYYTMSPTYSICKNHGYISGEVLKCPTCGETTETYSRITGYYRPIQNWNDGKLHEFADRKEYTTAAGLSFTRQSITAQDLEQITDQKKVKVEKVYLVTTKTCPNCKVAEKLLSENHVAYEKLDANENAEFSVEHSIKQAPTLIVETSGGYVKYIGLGGVKEFLENMTQQV